MRTKSARIDTILIKKVKRTVKKKRLKYPSITFFINKAVEKLLKEEK